MEGVFPTHVGVFRHDSAHAKNRVVFPTHVGVFLSSATREITALGLPHARGGVSDEMGKAAHVGVSSPRTWGCFRAKVRREAQGEVFPTHVGVFLGLILY